jgi:hypothetical protein
LQLATIVKHEITVVVSTIEIIETEILIYHERNMLNLEDSREQFQRIRNRCHSCNGVIHYHIFSYLLS